MKLSDFVYCVQFNRYIVKLKVPDYFMVIVVVRCGPSAHSEIPPDYDGVVHNCIAFQQSGFLQTNFFYFILFFDLFYFTLGSGKMYKLERFQISFNTSRKFTKPKLN